MNARSILCDVKCILAEEAGTFADVQLNGSMYDVHRTCSLQATLEQINRKGLLQERIEDIRVYSRQGMRRTSTLLPRCPRSASGYFLISLPFFLDPLLLPPRLSFNNSRSRDVASDLSSILNSRFPQNAVNSRRNFRRDCISLLLCLLITEQEM